MNARSRLLPAIALATALGGCAETIEGPGPAPDAATPDAAPVERCPVAPAAPLAVAHLTDRGPVTLPAVTIPVDAEEQAFNHAQGPDEQYAAWDTSQVGDGRGGLLVYFGRYLLRPGFLNFQDLGVGLAHAPSPDGVAAREPGFLFHPPEYLFSSGALVDAGDVYVYACTVVGFLDAECRLARAPVGLAGVHDAYTAWDGGAWVRDLGRAAVVVRGVNGMTMSWNRHLGRYLAVYGGIVSDDVFLRTTARPEGPWSAPVLAFHGLPAGDGHIDFNAAQHPELAPADGCTVVVTYAHPTSPSAREVRRVEPTLQ